MMPGRCTQTRGRCHDSCDGRPPTPPPPRLSSTGSGGWTRLPPTAGSTSSKDMTTGRPTYADATACPPGLSAASNPGAPSVTQLLSLRSIQSVCPCTSIHPLTVTNWTHDWDNSNNKAGGTEESKDDNLNVNGTAETTLDDVPVVKDTTAAAETTLDDVPAVKDTTAAALTDTAHGDDDAAFVGSSSPPLLSSPHCIVPLTGTAPPPSDTFILHSGASIHYSARPTPPPTPPIGDLPATAADGMATLQRAISDHLAKLDQQRISIGEKYDALHDLLVMAQTEFNASAIVQ
jgi:hypothetical protein